MQVGAKRRNIDKGEIYSRHLHERETKVVYRVIRYKLPECFLISNNTSLNPTPQTMHRNWRGFYAYTVALWEFSLASRRGATMRAGLTLVGYHRQTKVGRLCTKVGGG